MTARYPYPQEPPSDVFKDSHPVVPDYSRDLMRIASDVKLLNTRVTMLLAIASACLGILIALVLR